MSADCKLCLAVLCGLPASGKTSLTQLLATHTAGQSDSKPGACNPSSDDCIRYIMVEYDALLPADVEKALIEEEIGGSSNDGQSPWKQYRSDVYECVAAFIECLKAGASSLTIPQGVGAEIGRRFKATMLPQLQGVIGGVTEGVARGMAQEGAPKLCVVIDDNMYYHSMRYRYYQLARKYTMGFCQIYLKCDVNEAIMRNSERACPVAREVMVTMATKFEPPDPETNSWEIFNQVSTLQDISIHAVHHMVEKALDNPVLPLTTLDEEQQNQSRQICSASFLHQSDQILRKLVSEEMVAAKKRNLSRPELKDLAQQLQARRRRVLEQLQGGKVSVPASILPLAADSAPIQLEAPDSTIIQPEAADFAHHTTMVQYIGSLFHGQQNLP